MPGARMTVAANRITSWCAVYTGELASAAAVGELECVDPRPAATRDGRPVDPGRGVLIVPTCRRRNPCRSADSLATSAQSRGRHNRRCADVATTANLLRSDGADDVGPGDVMGANALPTLRRKHASQGAHDEVDETVSCSADPGLAIALAESPRVPPRDSPNARKDRSWASFVMS